MKNNLTVAEYEKFIKEKYNARKIELDYFRSHLSQFIFNKYNIDLNIFKTMLPSKLVDVFTEIKIKDEWFYALYLIPLKNKRK